MPDWPEILRRDGPAAWRAAYRLVGNRADADECLQEAILSALEVCRREEVRHWRALLVRLAAARALDRLRRRRRRGPVETLAEGDALDGSATSPEQRAEEAELAERLRLALARIPPRQAEAFCLHALEGWTHAEVARHLATSADAVGVLVHRARGRLRALLAGPLDIASAPGGDATRPREEGS